MSVNKKKRKGAKGKEPISISIDESYLPKILGSRRNIGNGGDLSCLSRNLFCTTILITGAGLEAYVRQIVWSTGSNSKQFVVER